MLGCEFNGWEVRAQHPLIPCPWPWPLESSHCSTIHPLPGHIPTKAFGFSLSHGSQMKAMTSLLRPMCDERSLDPGLTNSLQDDRLTPTSVTMGLLRGTHRGMAHPPAQVSRPSLAAGSQPRDCDSLRAMRGKFGPAARSKVGSSAP